MEEIPLLNSTPNSAKKLEYDDEFLFARRLNTMVFKKQKTAPRRKKNEVE